MTLREQMDLAVLQAIDEAAITIEEGTEEGDNASLAAFYEVLNDYGFRVVPV